MNPNAPAPALVAAAESASTAPQPAAPAPAARPSSGTPAERQVLRCESTADFLAALPFLAGFTDTSSVFIVLFNGRRAGDVLRFDLPPHQRHASADALRDGILALLQDTGAGPGGPAVVITTSQRFESDGPPPWHRFARRLEREFRDRGWPMRDLAVIAADGWASYLGPGAIQHRPLAELTNRQITATIGAQHGPPEELERIGELPRRQQARAEAVDLQLIELRRRQEARGAHPASDRSSTSMSSWVHGTARVADTCFNDSQSGRDGKGELDPRLLARVIDAAQLPDRWLILALTALTRAEFVVRLSEQDAPKQLTGIPVGADDDPSAQRWSIRALLLSLSAEVPARRRLRRAIDVLEDAAAHARREDQPGVLAMLAWLWWLHGMQSVSQRLVRQSLELEPGHELSRMVGALNATPPAAHVNRLRATFNETA